MVDSFSMSSSVEHVLDLVEVALVGALAALLGGIADLVDPVDAARPQHGRIEGLGQVGGHHHQDPVLGGRLGPHSQHLAHDAVEEPPGLLEARQLGQQGLQGAHSAAAAAHHHDRLPPRPGPAVAPVAAVGAQAAGPVVATQRGLVQRPLRPRRQVGIRRAGLGGVAQECREPLRAEAPVAAHTGAPVAQSVGLIEEGHHAPVAKGQLAELAEQALHLENAHPHEHVHEGTGINEHEGFAGLARGGLGQQRLAGAGWAVEQDAAGGVAADLLDGLGVLEGRSGSPAPAP